MTHFALALARFVLMTIIWLPSMVVWAVTVLLYRTMIFIAPHAPSIVQWQWLGVTLEYQKDLRGESWQR